MRHIPFALLFALVLMPACAGAQTTKAQYVNQDGSQSAAQVQICPDPNNAGKTTACTNVPAGGASGTPSQPTVSVTNASTQIAAAAAYANFIKVCVPATASTGVWVNWAGAAATAAAPAEYMPPGQCDSWVKQTGFLPTSAINAISNSGATIGVTVIGG